MKTFTSSLGGISSNEQIEALQGANLVTLYNELTGKPIKKFADRATGLKRTNEAFELWCKQQAGTTQPKQASSDTKTYRPESMRGQIIELASKAGGAKYTDLLAVEKSLTPATLNATLSRIADYNGLKVDVSGVAPAEGQPDERVVVISGVLRTRKAFEFPAKKEQRAHRPGTKRAQVLEKLLSKEGATFVEIQTLTKWEDRTAYEGVRLLHSYLGYGLRESATGQIFAFAK